MTQNVIDILKERGLIDGITDDELPSITDKPIKLYCGFDPTGESLHLGSMVAIMGLAWFQRCGHTPFAIVGGATGLVGDPSGKRHERPLLDIATIERNLDGIRKNLKQILDFNCTNKPIILNNYDWFKKFSLIEFLRDIGKYFRLGPMLAKDSVRTRLESEEGMSFTEFSYQLLQGYDFLHLYREFDVTLQIGGSDQWGNITAGIDLTRKLLGKSVYGITFPLLTREDGQKFGKTEKGAVWLSPHRTSPYEFYQYLVRTTDADVIKLMRMLTFMPMEEIRNYEEMMLTDDYTPNTAQKKLAEEVTRIVHGETGLEAALKVTEGVAPGSEAVLNIDILDALGEEIPNKNLQLDEVINVKLIDIMVLVGLQDSKGQARRLIRNGGVSINNKKVSDETYTIETSDLIDNRMLLIAAGKKNKMLIRLS